MRVKNQFILMVSVLVLMSACGKKQAESPKSGSAAGLAVADWSTQKTISDDGSVSVSESRMSQDAINRTRAEYRRTNLIQIPIDGKYRTQVFRISDETIGDYANKLFVAPKLFSYGSQQGGRLVPRVHEDGTVTLSFNVAFVDGANKTIQSPQADEKEVVLPDSFVVNYPEEFKAVLRNQYHADNGISILPGCPKKISLRVGRSSYDVTPNEYLSGDYCQPNVPVAVSIRLSKEDAKSLLEESLYAGIVDVVGVYETKVSFPVVNIKVQFDRSKVFEDLRMQLGVKAWFLDVDIRSALTRILQKQMMKVTIQGTSSDRLNAFVDQAVREFFEPMYPDPKTGTSECGGAPVCFRYSQTSVQQSSTLDLSWSQAENALIGQSYVTSTKLKPTPNKITIGKERGCQSDCRRLVNDGSARETGLTVIEGNQVVIEPSYLIQETRVLPPDVRRIDHDVCTKMVPFPGGIIGGTMCIEKQNQWTEITNYTDRSMNLLVDQPTGLLNDLYEGIYFRFQYIESATGNRKVLDCPVGSFPREGNGQSLVVRLRNVPTCSPFSGNPSEVPMLSIINRIQSTESYPVGRMVRLWNGQITENPVVRTYNPKIEFAGTLSIPGYAFMASESQGSVKAQ